MNGFFFKLFRQMRHSGARRFFGFGLPRTKFDYRKEVGDGLDSSVVTAPMQWIQRAFVEAPLTVVEEAGGVERIIGDHRMPRLLNRPNPFHTEPNLWFATLLSYLTAGNAYWLKVRNMARQVVEIWYVPHWRMEPVWPQDGTRFISHYEYSPGNGEKIDLEVEDVVHFRCGVDPRNDRLGFAPLHGVLREIFMDLEASNFVASLLRNSGVPGVVISPASDEATVAPEDIEAVKQWFKQQFGGDRRGDPLVMGAPTKVHQYGFNPQQMDLSSVRDVAEERVCASLGIPSAVVGFGTGMQQTKVGATLKQLRREAWTSGVLPLHRSLAAVLETQLLPDFNRHVGLSVRFDSSNVAALQEDENERVERVIKLVLNRMMTIGEGRVMLGQEAKPEHDIYMQPTTHVPVQRDGSPALPAMDGNGDATALLTNGSANGAANIGVSQE